MSEPKVDLDEVLQGYGLNQRYHIKLTILVMLAFATNGIYSTNYVFVVEEVKYRCITQNVSQTYCTLLTNETCEEWIYDDPHSFVAEFGLACQDWKTTTVGTVHNLGYICGLLIIGPISDRIGRKPAAILTGTLGAVFGTLRSFSLWYFFYNVMEFLEAAFGDSFSPMYVLSLECVSTKKRTLFVLITHLGYIFGCILFAGAAWAVPYWRTFLRVIYIPSFFFLSYIWLCDESPRWLLTNGKKKEAIAILQKAAKTNNTTIDQSTLDKMACENSDNLSKNQETLKTILKHSFQSSVLRCRFFVSVVWWTTSTFVTYVLTINSVSLEGNKYLNYVISSAVEAPATVIVFFVLERYRRKKPLITCFLIGAAFCLAQPFIPSDLSWLSIVFFMAGKLVSSIFLTIVYLYTSELFPTHSRNSMQALSSSLGRIGSLLAPETPLLIQYWSGLPSFVSGLAALFAGLVTFLVPDVKDDALPDTVQEAEAIGKQKTVRESGEEKSR